MKRKEAKYTIQENRDFIPYRVAIRLKESIKFSVQLDYRSKDLNNGQNLDDETVKMLDQYEKDCDRKGEFIPFHEWNYDYESYPVLRHHKIRLLEIILKSFIDRKYKISFCKGMKILIE